MYKAGQGMPSRIGAAVIGLILGCYAALCWYYWRLPAAAADWSGYVVSVGFIGAFAMLALFVAGFCWLAFRSPRSGDYLIDMDDELRKVVWPSVMPLFDPQTEAWGSTYVVIVCAVLFTIFVWLADLFLQLAVSYGLFQMWLFAR